MDFDFELLTFAIPIILGFVQLLKMTFPELGARWWPLATQLVAVSLVLLIAAAFHDLSNPPLVLLTGILAGLSASGLYSIVKMTVGRL